MPYGEHTHIRDYRQNIKILQIAVALFNEVHLAAQAFLAGDLAAFDPHVGDNHCQIRACMLLDYYHTFKSNHVCRQAYDKFLDQLNKTSLTARQALSCHSQNVLRWQKKQYKNPFFGLSTGEFLEHLDLNIYIPRKVFVLTLCRFLTHYRTLNAQQNFTIDYPRLQSDLNLSRYSCKRIVHSHQKLLSIFSCKYIAKLVRRSKLPISQSQFNCSLQQDDNDRYVLPCFFTMPILIERLQELKAPITLIIRNPFIQEEKCEHINFELNEEKYGLSHSSGSIFSDSIGFIIHCVSFYQGKSFSEFKQNIKQHNIADLLLACMSSHPQFSGEKLAALKNNPFKSRSGGSNIRDISRTMEKQLYAYRNLSNHLGCHKDKPQTLLLQHIFADSIHKQVMLANQNRFYADQIKNLTVISFHEKSKRPNFESDPQFEVA